MGEFSSIYVFFAPFILGFDVLELVTNGIIMSLTRKSVSSGLLASLF